MHVDRTLELLGEEVNGSGSVTVSRIQQPIEFATRPQEALQPDRLRVLIGELVGEGAEEHEVEFLRLKLPDLIAQRCGHPVSKGSQRQRNAGLHAGPVQARQDVVEEAVADHEHAKLALGETPKCVRHLESPTRIVSNV